MLRPYADLEPITLDEVLEKQGNLLHPTERPESRDTFYDSISGDDYIGKLKVGLQMKERVKAVLPADIVKFIKRNSGF